MNFEVFKENWPLKEPFVIARETMTELPLILLSIDHDGHKGFGEAAGVDYRGETPATMAREISDYLSPLEAPPSRMEILRDMPAGGARNALDCAIWDYEAKCEQRNVADIIGSGLNPLITAFTVSLAEPEIMAKQALSYPEESPLKLKLGGGVRQDLERIEAVRDARSNARIIVDVNEGWSIDELRYADSPLHGLGVELVEQPLARGSDELLAQYNWKIPLCADESFDVAADLVRCEPYYQYVNVKLDKCGGLTEAMRIVKQAQACEMGLFVGSMLGTSLGMMPAAIIGQYCDYIDLDGAALLRDDRTSSNLIEGGKLTPVISLWGDKG